MRVVHRDSRPSTNALDTINAAASAIASGDNRAPQATPQKRKWAGWFRAYWCFGYNRHRKRIGHAVLVPETPAPRNDSSATENSTQANTITLPFVAPPSSPASFLQSEPPSASQSPAGVLSLTSISASMYSPTGPSSIFAIGPYAHETQLVSPPVFSTFTTEPSTAPFTPPPESVHLTTPSSPEVPFAQLLDPSMRNGEGGLRFPLSSNYEFQSYQLHPGSPVGQLISPSSGISGSGTSSPFPDVEFATGGPYFLEFRLADPPKLLNLDKLSSREWGSSCGSGTLTPDAVRPRSCSVTPDRQFPDFVSQTHSDDGSQNNGVAAADRILSLAAESIFRCKEQNPAAPPIKIILESTENGTEEAKTENSRETVHNSEQRIGETSNETPEKASTAAEKTVPRHEKHRSITLGSLKEFNFENTDGGVSHNPDHGPDWWANGSDVEKEEDTAAKNWSFFPTMQTSVS